MKNKRIGIGISIFAIIGALAWLIGFFINKSSKKSYFTVKHQEGE